MDFDLAVDEIPNPQEQAIAKAPLGNIAPIKKDLAQYEKGLAKLEKESQAIEVKDRESASRAIELAGGAKTLGKTLKKAQDNLTDEAKAYVKSITNLFRPYLERFAKVEAVTKDKAAAFEVQERLAQQKREADAREEARKLQEKIDFEAREQREAALRKARDAAEKLQSEKDAAARAILEQTVKEETEAAALQTPTVVVPVTAASPTVTRTETGSGYLRATWDYRIVDETKIPRDFMAPDEKKIRQAVKNGLRKIEGIEIYEKSTIAIRT